MKQYYCSLHPAGPPRAVLHASSKKLIPTLSLVAKFLHRRALELLELGPSGGMYYSHKVTYNVEERCLVLALFTNLPTVAFGIFNSAFLVDNVFFPL